MTPDLCRVAVHLGDSHVDLMLPNAIPVALLLPALWDIATSELTDVDPFRTPLARQLCALGGTPLDPSKSLTENGIVDGAMLVLTAQHPPPALIVAGEPADQLACAAARAAHRWTVASSQVTAWWLITILVGLAGFVTVPGPAGMPHLLLGTTAAGIAAILAARSVARAVVGFEAAVTACTLIASTSLAITAFGGSGHRVGVLLTVLSVLLLACSGRLTLTICGISRTLVHALQSESGPTEVNRGIARAPGRLTALLVATAVCAPAGTGLVLAQRPGMADHLLSAIAAVTFLLMSRSHLDVIRRWSLLSSGTVSAAASLVALRLSHPGSADLLVGVLLATAGSVAWFGSRLGRSTFSPLARRCADVAEGVVLAAVVPTACGALGLYGDLH